MKRFLCVLSLLSLSALPAAGETLVGLTVTNQLVRFDSATPGTVSTATITGLTAGDSLVGIDLRPATNQLYGVAIGSGAGAGVGRVYVINPLTGVATLSSTLSADPADVTAPNPFTSVSGTVFGVDFNPTVDRLRIVSDTGQNLRVNVTSGLTQFDVAEAYISGDPNFGSPPMIVSAAYSNNVAGAVTTTLFALDANLGELVTQTPANNGTLNSVALVSSSVFADAAFDISGATGTAYVVLDGITLATLNLTNGTVTELGAIGTIGSINGLAVLAAVPEPASGCLIIAGVLAMVSRRRGR